ncbi:MAG: hypothetical protein HWE14_01080 [Flavobacteriia bacterium]|nr:hypothetical protein [Flavobacteriia bacterium]
MKRISMIHIFAALALAITFGCEQSDPSFNGREGDTLTFSGLKWDIKSSSVVVGPGPNYFSKHPNDVFIDDKGYLHLSVDFRDGQWRSTEIISQDTMGYGTYVWTLEGDPVNIDPNLVIGLFTWDNNTFQTQANSEVDIEFSKWGDEEEEYTLQYGVQPIAFGPYNPERVDKPEEDNSNWIGVSTHAFTWTDTLITWESWKGSAYGNGAPDASWSFDLSNPARIKYEGGNQSDAIIIPAPGNTTNARMNLWLVNGPAGPAFGTRQEIIIRKFDYIPL